MKRNITFFILLSIFFRCSYKNPYDHDEKSYIAPVFTVAVTNAGDWDSDTLNGDSLTIILKSNEPIYYQWRMDTLETSTAWSDCEISNENVYAITLVDFDTGGHTVHIRYCYYPDNYKHDTSVSFYRAVVPEIQKLYQSPEAITVGSCCTLRVAAAGTGKITYGWFKDGSELDTSENGPALVLTDVSRRTSGNYYCRAATKWGSATSNTISIGLHHTVTYNGNGNTNGAAPSDTNLYAQGDAVHVSGTADDFVKRGFFFNGWNTNKDGSGIQSMPGNQFTMGTEAITLYAQWIVRDIDGNVYSTVTIGTQTWMAENLKTIRFNDGASIPSRADTAWNGCDAPAYCWYDNDIKYKKSEGAFGALYNWYAINTGKLAPAGWHVATEEEWLAITKHYGGEGAAGGMLKEAGSDLWDSTETNTADYTDFQALPGGYCDTLCMEPVCNDIGNSGHWWTSTEYNARSAWSRCLNRENITMGRNACSKRYGFSVRCVRDE